MRVCYHVSHKGEEGVGWKHVKIVLCLQGDSFVRDDEMVDLLLKFQAAAILNLSRLHVEHLDCKLVVLLYGGEQEVLKRRNCCDSQHAQFLELRSGLEKTQLPILLVVSALGSD